MYIRCWQRTRILDGKPRAEETVLLEWICLKTEFIEVDMGMFTVMIILITLLILQNYASDTHVLRHFILLLIHFIKWNTTFVL